jgi:hypothetical protein
MVSGSFELRIAAHSRGVEKLYHESAQNATKKRPHAQTSVQPLLKMRLNSR